LAIPSKHRRAPLFHSNEKSTLIKTYSATDLEDYFVFEDIRVDTKFLLNKLDHNFGLENN
jgi:hypothetical protein